LSNFYNSLTSKGTLSWSVGNDLCGQTGVTCDSSTPYQRVINLDLLSYQLVGTIPVELGNLTSLIKLFHLFF